MTHTCHFQHFSAAGSSFRVGRCTTESAAGCIWISTSKWHKMRHVFLLWWYHWRSALCSWAVLFAAALMGQRLASGLPRTRAPGVNVVPGLILGLQQGHGRLVSRVFVCLYVNRITRKLLIRVFFESLGNILTRTIDQRVRCLIPLCFFINMLWLRGCCVLSLSPAAKIIQVVGEILAISCQP